MFTPEERDRIREWLIEAARADSRLVAAAAVGASAGGSDRWSDLDLTFGVAEGVTVEEVLADWTDRMMTVFDAAVLFDLSVHTTMYRVFLLPGALQVDLSFTPAGEFGARGPRFHLLFGEALEHPYAAPPPLDHLVGLGVHHVVRARICITRGRLWQAEYWIHATREEALILACRHRGLEFREGRGYDRLPAEVLDLAARSLLGTLTVENLNRAFAAVITLLVQEAGDLPVTRTRWVRPALEELSRDSRN